MKEDIKKAWCDALTSGEYHQGIGSLRLIADTPAKETSFKFCCLGVLTDLYIKAHPDDAGWYTGPVEKQEQSTVFYGRSGFLDARVMGWAGLNRQDPVVDLPYTIGKGSRFVGLSRVNDLGTPFSKIAALIKEQL